jgi:hypothetical protein
VLLACAARVLLTRDVLPPASPLDELAVRAARAAAAALHAASPHLRSPPHDHCCCASLRVRMAQEAVPMEAKATEVAPGLFVCRAGGCARGRACMRAISP